MALELTNQQMLGLQRALLSAYPSRPPLEQMLFFQMDVNLNEVSGPGPLTDVVFNVIRWAKSKGRLEELVAAARKANEGNPDLKAFLVEVGVTAVAPPAADGPVAQGLQTIVVETGAVAGVAPFSSGWFQMGARRQAAVCQIETGADAKGWGTGFLVASDVVMTNHHVTTKVKEKGGDLQARFDFASPGTGTVVKAVDAGWELAGSEPGELDYSLIRLAAKAGEQALNGGRRGSVKARVDHTFAKDEMIFILQHPNRQPLQVGAGYLRDVNSWVNRIAYTTNTEAGSSGSPCFNMGWELIALHHHGDDFTNHGTTMKAIVADLKAKGLAGLLG